MPPRGDHEVGDGASRPAAHTPGPWTIEYVIDGAFRILDAESCVVVSRNEFPRRHIEFVANAWLIAAAPDMLAALFAAKAKLEEGGCDCGDQLCALCWVEQAIRQAEGRGAMLGARKR